MLFGKAPADVFEVEVLCDHAGVQFFPASVTFSERYPENQFLCKSVWAVFPASFQPDTHSFSNPSADQEVEYQSGFMGHWRTRIHIWRFK
jgi:hypothetical protein